MGREDAAVCYGMTGGIPAYIEKVDPTVSLEDNIKRLFLTPTGYLFEEPSNLLLQECRNPEQYDAIVQAIAQGRSKISEIASSMGIPASNVKSYVDKLASLGIVERELPLNETSNKRAVYLLSDQMFRFWYKFVPQNIGLIQNDMPRWRIGALSRTYRITWVRSLSLYADNTCTNSHARANLVWCRQQLAVGGERTIGRVRRKRSI